MDPSNPQYVLSSALTSGNWAHAERLLSKGATLWVNEPVDDPMGARLDASLQEALWWDALQGSLAVGPSPTVGWQWLLDRGLSCHTFTDLLQSLGEVLVRYPLECADWMVAHAPIALDTPMAETLVISAVKRERGQIDALEWLAGHGLDLSGPTTIDSPSILLSVEKHQFNAGAQVNFLLSRGVKPEETRLKHPVYRNTPLNQLAMIYADAWSRNALTAEQEQAFRPLWITLVEAGEDTHATVLGHTPEQRIKGTHADVWWQAHLRAQRGLMESPAVTAAHRARHRP